MDKQIVQSQDIPIRPRYGLMDSAEETTEMDTSRRRSKKSESNDDEVSSSYMEIVFGGQHSENSEAAAAQEITYANEIEEDVIAKQETESDQLTVSCKQESDDRYFYAAQKNSTDDLLIARHIRQQQQRQNLPQIDVDVLNDIEIDAQYLAASVDNLLDNLCSLLHSISSITADNVEVHRNAVNRMTDCMDANIKSMYTIVAKTEEITKSMKPTEQLTQRIREIKRLVDMLENTI